MTDIDPYERRSARETADESNRSPTRRDRDRILYCDPFRRLGGVTQVALGAPEKALHNRLTHSLKVEQVGLSIHSKLVGDSASFADACDADAVAAACLAHDIGHPPFGHAGEMELDELVVCEPHRLSPRKFEQRQKNPCQDCKLEDGFEGNAQSFRVIAVLAGHRHSEREPLGLDLTRASLLATSKYPWLRGHGPKKKKWGAYDCDAEILRWSSGSTESSVHVSADVMDWADDISYAVHDIEDFFRINLIPLDDYRTDTEPLRQFLEYVESPAALGPLEDDVREAFKEMLAWVPTSRFTGTADDLAVLDRMRSRLLTDFIGSATSDGTSVTRDRTQEGINSILKQFIWFHVIDEAHLSAIQTGQRRVLREIFTTLEEITMKAHGTGQESPDAHQLRRLFPGLARAIELGRQQNVYPTLQKTLYRGILDYMSSLSDSEAYSLHAVLQGTERAGQI